MLCDLGWDASSILCDLGWDVTYLLCELIWDVLACCVIWQWKTWLDKLVGHANGIEFTQPNCNLKKDCDKSLSQRKWYKDLIQLTE